MTIKETIALKYAKIKERQKIRRQEKNIALAEELKELKAKREIAEGRARLVEFKASEEARIKKARKIDYEQSGLGRAVKSVKGFAKEYQKKQRKKKPPVYGFGGSSFNQEKLRL